MRIFCVTLVVLSLVVADFLSDALGLPEDAQKGWDYASTTGLIAFALYIVALTWNGED